MRVPITKVPIDVRRRAARHLESIRGTWLGEGADHARLGDEACALDRPDVKGVAYWEIEVVDLSQDPARDASSRAGRGSGFIIVSTGRHDVPIPHWSLHLTAPSRRLEAEAQVGEGKPAKLYKLDALAYTAEDAKGKYLGHLGVFPPALTPSATAVKNAPQIRTVVAAPRRAARADPKKAAPLAQATSGAKAVTFKGAAWKSWPEAKRMYAKNFAPQLKALERRAVVSWGVEDITKEFGEGIHAGEALIVPLLAQGTATLSAEGADAVKMTRLKRTPPALQLTALDVVGNGERQFTVEIRYRDGTSESLHFFVVPRGTPSNEKPVVLHPVVDRQLDPGRRG